MSTYREINVVTLDCRIAQLGSRTTTLRYQDSHVNKGCDVYYEPRASHEDITNLEETRHCEPQSIFHSLIYSQNKHKSLGH